MDVLDRLRLEVPVVQAGMGGGVAGAELAGAVSAAGALGTVGTAAPRRLADELRRAGEIAGARPVAVNLLLPFVERGHVEAVVEVAPHVAVLFYGVDRDLVGRLRGAGCVVLQQVGTVEQARQALDAGVDGLIVQGIEAGGHLLGRLPTVEAVPRVRAVAGDRPVLAAGGIADHDAVRAVLDAGADAAVAGTRFLLTHASGAHPRYRRRVLEADRTLETELFGLGWAGARHRVVPNAATERWGGRSGRGAWPVRTLNRSLDPLVRHLPLATAERMVRLQRPWLPLLSPQPPVRGMPDEVVEVAPLYAGESIHRIERIVSAAEAVALLAGR